MEFAGLKPATLDLQSLPHIPTSKYHALSQKQPQYYSDIINQTL